MVLRGFGKSLDRFGFLGWEETRTRVCDDFGKVQAILKHKKDLNYDESFNADPIREKNGMGRWARLRLASVALLMRKLAGFECALLCLFSVYVLSQQLRHSVHRPTMLGSA